MQIGSKRAQSSSFYSLLYLILLSNIWRWLMITGKCIFGVVASRFSDRTTEPMAVFKYLVNCSKIAAVNNLHIKNPNEAADPIIYWLNILIGLLLPEPNLHMRKGQKKTTKKKGMNLSLVFTSWDWCYQKQSQYIGQQCRPWQLPFSFSQKLKVPCLYMLILARG